VAGAKRGATVTEICDMHPPLRELAYRETDGLEVILFWHEFTNELTVCVSDTRSGAYFELAADAKQALDVFYHPYAHAAAKGIPYQEELLPLWAQAAASPVVP
jgi:hypothetical protein